MKTAPPDAFGVLGRQQQAALGAEREADEHGALGVRRVEDGERVGCELALVVRL